MPRWCDYLLLELLGGVVVHEGHREGHGLVLAHQCQQHPRVCGGPDPSHNLYPPCCLISDVWGCPSCKERCASPGHPGGAKA